LKRKVIDGILNTVATACPGDRVNRRAKSRLGFILRCSEYDGKGCNNNENTSAAADGNAAGHGTEGSNPLNSFAENGALQLLQRSTKSRCDGRNKRADETSAGSS
jgi:hypothetical protein